MARATWNGAVLAETDDIEIVEGNLYFPASSLNMQYFAESPSHTTCPWKGEASYYSIVVDGRDNDDAAWYYPSTKDAAKNIEGRVAFWRGVVVER
jgi:uncharacterized protein (DUF427 family)